MPASLIILKLSIINLRNMRYTAACWDILLGGGEEVFLYSMNIQIRRMFKFIFTVEMSNGWRLPPASNPSPPTLPFFCFPQSSVRTGAYHALVYS